MKCQNDRNYRVYNFLPCGRKDYEISVSLALQLKVPALSREFLFSFTTRPVLMIFFQSFFVLCKTQIIMCSFSKARKISSRASGKMAEFWKDLSLVFVCVPVHAALLYPVLRTVCQADNVNGKIFWLKSRKKTKCDDCWWWIKALTFVELVVKNLQVQVCVQFLIFSNW